MKRIFSVFCIAMLFTLVLIAEPVGDVIWSYETDFIIHSSPAIAPDGTIYIGSHDNCLHAVNPDGTGKWKFQTNGDVSSSPAIGKDGTIYFGSKDGRFYALNPDGTEKWHYQTGAKITASPAIGKNGMVYIGSRDCYFYAFNSEGELKWVYDTGGVIFSTPAIAKDGTVYIASNPQKLFSFEPDGSLKWTFDLLPAEWHEKKNAWKTSPVLGPDGTIYMHSRYYYFYAINPDGTEKWKTGLDGYATYTPAIDRNGNIYSLYKKVRDGYPSSGVLFVCAHDSSGHMKWLHKEFRSSYFTKAHEIWCSPVVGRDGSIYIFYNDGLSSWKGPDTDLLLIRVFNADGEMRQMRQFLPHKYEGQYTYQLGSPVIDDDGVMYIGWLDHKLHAIQTESYGMDWSSWPCFGQNLQGSHRDDGIYGPVVSSDEESPAVAFEDSNNDDVIFSAVEDPSSQPSTFSLSQNYPNPFNNQTQIQYQLPQNTFVSLKIFNTMGKAVQELVNEVQTSGVYQVHWNGLDQLGNHVPSGMYFMELKAGDYREMRKMLLVE